MDMNGDGLPDRIWQNNDYKLYIKYNTGGGFETDTVMFNTQDKYIRRVVTTEDTMEAHTASDYMDINGDGLPDRLVQSNSSTLTVRFNTGSGFCQPVTFPSTGNYLRQSDYYYNTHLKDYFDMNGDGFLDRVYRNSKYPDFNDPLHIRFSESEYPRENFLLKINHPAGGSTSYAYKPVDKNLNPGYKYNKWVIESITTEDGLGNEEKIEYEYSGGLLDTASREDKGFQKVTHKNSTGGFAETFYYQSGPESGLIEKIIERSETGKIIKYLYNIYEDYAVRSDHYGYGISQGRDNAGPDIIVQAVKLVETNEYNVDGNTENDLGSMPDGIPGDDWHNRKKEISYDTYGNKTKITSGDYSNGEWTLDKNEQYIEYINSTEYWMFLPMREYENSYNKNDMFVMSDDKKIFYDNKEEYGETGGQGLPTKIQLYRSSADFITKRIVYDSYGNIIETIDPKGNSTTYEYDPIFRIYKIKEISPGVNGINLILQTEYNTYCLPDKIINPNNSVTELFYDTFYRLIKKVLPYDNETYPTEVYEYHEADSSTEGDGTKFPWIKKIMREVENTTESLEIYSYMDGMGRTIQTKAEAMNDAGSPCWLTVNNWQYIQAGKRIKAASMPFYSSQYTFDRPLIPEGACTYEKEWFSEDEGHVTLKQNSGSTPLVSRTVSKLNKTISIDPDGHIKITSIAPWENKTSDTTYTGEYPNNEIYSRETTKITFEGTTTIDSNDNVIYNTKDWLGNTLLMLDGDTGVILYQYDDNGNIVEKTDAKGNVITYFYDALNRLTTKMLPGGNSINYYYDGIDETICIPFSGDHGEGLGKLTRVVLQNGIDGENYTYDSRGRIVKVAKIIDGERRVMEVVYDSMNRVVKEILPDGEEVISSYSNGGMLTSIVGDESYVTDIIYTTSGQIDSITYGNGITTTYNYFDEENEYDPGTNLNLTYLLESISTSDGTTMDLHYQYDRNGNIVQKNNLLDADLSENFMYDDLNRLIKAESNIYGTKNYEYDRINNIIEKDGYAYQYHEDKPHAVISDSRNTYTYDENGNMIQAAGQSTITIRAKGTGVSEDPPEMELWLAGEKQMSWIITNTEYKEYTWHGYWDGNSTVDLKYTNDNQAGGENTDLYIDWVEINGIRRQAEEPEVFFDTTKVAFDGNSIFKNVDTTAWDADVASLKKFTGSGGVEFTSAQNDKFLLCGLADANTETNSQTIDYAILFVNNSYFTIYEKGVNVTPSDLGALQLYNATIPFQVLRQGNCIVYKRDGVEIYRSEAEVDPAVELMVYCAFKDNGAALNDVKWVDVADVSYIDPINVEFGVDGNSISKNADTTAWDAGAASLKKLTGSCGVEFIPAQNDKFLLCGLADANTVTNSQTIDYAILFVNNTYFTIYEKGVNVTPAGLGELQRYNSSIPFQVLRQGNSIVYKRDGAEIYRSEVAVDQATELMVYCAFKDNGAAFSEVKWVDVDAVNYIDPVNVEFGIDGNSISKNADTTAWDAGAASLKKFTGSCGVEFTPAQNDKFLLCGLADANTVTNSQTIDYAILFVNNTYFTIYEKGVNVTPPDLGELLRYNATIPFQVLRQGNCIVYKRDGVEIYRSAAEVDPAVELMVYCAFKDNGAALSDVKWVDVAAVSYIDPVNVEFGVDGNSISKNADTTAWDAEAASFKKFTGSGGVEFTPAQNDKFLLCGLANANTVTNSQTIDYAILFVNNSYFTIYEKGVNVTPAGLGELQRYNSLIPFQVLRQGNLIVYKRDGVEIYRSETEITPDVELMVYCAFKDNGAALSEVKWVDEATGYVRWLNEAQILPGREQLDESGTLSFTFTDVPFPDRFFTYDTENRLTSISENGNTSAYYYDAGGQRIKKTEDGVETYYFFKNYEEVIESGSTKKIFYYYANNQRIAQRIITCTDNELLYIHTDHLGSSVKLTDETGGTVQAIAYDPYGKTVYYEGINDFSYQYTGQEFDNGTGLYYYNDRYYDPSLGRFISPDPVLAGLNRYTYCYNNPVMYTDPSGNNPLVYFLVYSIGSYLSGVSHSGSWNPGTWSKDVWRSSFLWPLQAVNGMSWSSNGSVDVYYTSGGSGTVYDPLAIASEQAYYAWETDFNIQLQKHMRYYTQFYDEELEYYAMGNTDYGHDGKYFANTFTERMYSIALSETRGTISTLYSNVLDVMGVALSIYAFQLGEKGEEIFLKGFNNSFNTSNWNQHLGRYHMAYGTWLKDVAAGIANNKDQSYFMGVHNVFQNARNIYLDWLCLCGYDIYNIPINEIQYR